MAETIYSLMTSPDSPAPLTITAATTLEDVINATILHPLPNPPTRLSNPGDDTPTHTSTQSDSQMRTPVTTPTQTPTYDSSPAEARFDDALFSLLDSPKKQTKLTRNPMFRDLQAILKADCSADATPNSLFQMLPICKTTNPVVSRELRLQQRLTKLSDYYPTQVTQLSSFHKYQASMVETDRYRELHQIASHQPTLRNAINHYYDQMLHQIMDRVEMSVGTMETLNSTQYQPAHTQYSPATNSATTQYSPVTNSAATQYPPFTNSALTQYSPATNSTPTQYSPATNSVPSQYSAATNLVPTQYSPATNSAATQYSPATNSVPTQYSPATNSADTQYSPATFSNEAPFRLNLRTRPSLSKQAIRLMEVWYHAHIDHPYPDTQDTETLATTGNITEEQVKKWFANKRNRSRNIRPISQIVRRKRQIQAAANRVARVPCLC
ncbi:hypothetical protein FSP39_011151 [Pinctada imbricata]|uniref:Homeobox domain-containing protein n=1 Tax=Pinctada imbricata TaxID=66713 RepID=A0AA88YJC3_PINIB|nr:hypothetical protein FSP39_011151 [Pinctada imbricata]